MTHSMRRLAAAALLALPLLTHAAEPVTVPLNLTPLPDTSQQIDMDMRMTMNISVVPGPNADTAKAEQMRQNLAASGMPMNMRMTMRQRVDAGARAADGSIPVKATMATLKSELIDAKGTAKPMPTPGTGAVTFSATLRNDRFEDIQLAGMENMPGMTPEAQKKMFEQIFDWAAKFNGQQMRVGETIELPLEMNFPMAGQQAGNGKFVGRYTLREVKNGVAGFDVEVGMNMNMAITPEAAASGAASAAAPDAAASAPKGPVSAAMNGSGKGRMDVRLADRLALRNTLDMTMTMNMQGPDGLDLRMDMGVKMDAKGSALKPAAAVKSKPKAKAQ